AGAGPADERIVLRRGAFRGDAHELAEVVVQRLRLPGQGETVADGHEQRSVAVEHQPRAVVLVVAVGRFGAEDDGDVRQPGAPQLAARHGDARARSARLQVAEIDAPV